MERIDLLAKIKSFVNTEEKKRLLANFFSLSILQGVNYILPLVTFPYLVRVLGVEYFGLLSFATATIAYFQIITDYGFNLTATREISIQRDNKERLTEIFSSVMTIKALLMTVSLILLTLFVLSFDKFSKDWLVYYLTFGMVIGQVLFPIWFFQGMERMKYITYLNILAKTIFTVAIFVFVRKQNDYYLVPLLNSLGFIIVGIWSLFIVKKEFGINFRVQSIETIKHHIREGWYVFFSSIMGNLYGQGNIIILGIFTSSSIVGYYSAAQKIAYIVVGLFQPFVQSVFPYITRIKGKNIKIFEKNLMWILKIVAIINLFLISLLFLFSNNIYTFITGYSDSIGFISFSAWLIISFFTIFNIVLNPIILALNRDREMSIMYTTVGGLFVIISMIFTYIYSYKGMLISMLLVELSIFTISLIIIKNGLKKMLGVTNHEE